MNYKDISDNDLVKAFECCYADKPCSECPLYKNYECTVPMEYSEQLPEMIVNLIKRLKSENEVLQSQ